jgi:hypothetical protein
MLTKPPETAQLDFAAVLRDIHKILLVQKLGLWIACRKSRYGPDLALSRSIWMKLNGLAQNLEGVP